MYVHNCIFESSHFEKISKPQKSVCGRILTFFLSVWMSTSRGSYTLFSEMTIGCEFQRSCTCVPPKPNHFARSRDLSQFCIAGIYSSQYVNIWPICIKFVKMSSNCFKNLTTDQKIHTSACIKIWRIFFLSIRSGNNIRIINPRRD